MICIERRRVVRARQRLEPLPIYIRGMRAVRPKNPPRYMCLRDRRRCGRMRMVRCVVKDVISFWLGRLRDRAGRLREALR